MNWLNLRTSQLREPPFIGSEPAARATWLCVLAHCIEMENGGRIEGARGWKDRQWQQTCGVTLEEIDQAGLLLRWDSLTLVVWAYPSEKQAEVEAKREAGRSGGKASGEARRKHSLKQNGSTASSTNEADLERKGKEKGIGKKEEPPKAPQAAQAPGSGRKKDNLPTSEPAKRISGIFHRRLTTEWSDDEIKAYKKLRVIDLEDLALVESHYAANWPPDRDENILRHNLETFLNNFHGEVDRARAATATRSPKPEAPRGEFARPGNPAPEPPEHIRLRREAEAAAALKGNGTHPE